MKRDIDVDGERLAVLVPSEVWEQLFALDKITSKDYVNSASLQAGKIEHFAGFAFINYEKVPGSPMVPKDSIPS